MKRKILIALLVFGLNAFGACSSGTQTCRISGLQAGHPYWYYYVDSNGNTHSGDFTPDSSTFDITGVDNSIECGGVDVGAYLLAEGPVV